MYGFMLELNLVKETEITKIIVLGDSLLTIQNFYRGYFPNDNQFKQLFHKIIEVSKHFHLKNFFHILRSQNIVAHKQVNIVFLLKIGQTHINDSIRLRNIL